jgi:predicted nuclease of predicted toxin-antitoxin system
VKFIIDAQLPPSLAAALREEGCDAVAVREIGLREAKDAAIWAYALQNNGVILTKDEDFAERCMAGNNAPVIIWLRIGNATNPELLAWFMPLWPSMLARVEAGDRCIEVR